MSNLQNRRPSFSSSTVSSLAKRQASDNLGKANAAAPPRLAKKRAPLSNITNQKNGSRISNASFSLVECSNKTAKTKKLPPPVCVNAGFASSVLAPQLNVKPSTVVTNKVASLPIRAETASIPPTISRQSEIDISSPNKSDEVSVSFDETMSTCDSFKSPQIEYIDKDVVSVVDSIGRKALSNLYITEIAETKGNYCSRDVLSETEVDNDKVVNIDDNYKNPQLCAAFACDIYKHLSASEAKKRPSADFMERIQKDINASMRGILIDWLVEVAEEYRLVPDTLYLTVNYIDRYLSGNAISRQRLQLLGVACMMIAAKYEEICAPQVEEFCYITDNTYFKEEVLEMESSVLSFLKFEITAPTAKCFLRRFARAAQGIHDAPSMQLECMANYIAELSLLDYNMLCYPSSLIAASAIFLAKYILDPTKRPWNPTLQHYTQYQPSDLRECVMDLHRLCCNSHTSTLPAVREKYSQHKYKFVAKKFCPLLIPPEFFNN